MKKRPGFVRDTAVMTGVSMIMQTVAVSFNLYLNKKIGTAGMGLFQLIMSVYSMAITFSSAGTRLAGARVCAESIAREKRGSSALFPCGLYALFTGSAVAAGMYIFSSFIAKQWIGNTGATLPLQILAPSLPFIALSCVFSGYFTASNLASPYYGIRLAEQIFKIATVVFLFNSGVFASREQSALPIVCGMTLSEIFSLFAAFLLFVFAIKKEKAKPKEHIKMPYILRIALPDLFGSSARSVLLTIEHLLIPKGFERSGASAETSLAAYGTLHAVVLPVLLWPGALLQSVATLIIPEAAKENALGNQEKINRLAQKLLHYTSVFAVGCGGIMLFFSGALAAALDAPEAKRYLFVLAPLVPVMYCDMTTDALLRGLDQQFYSMIYNIIDSALCVILVIFLLPRYAIGGYIFILYISEAINFFLSVSRLAKTCTLRYSLTQSLIKPGLCVICSCMLFLPSMAKMQGNKLATAFSVTVAAVLYLSVSLLTDKRKKEVLSLFGTEKEGTPPRAFPLKGNVE